MEPALKFTRVVAVWLLRAWQCAYLSRLSLAGLLCWRFLFLAQSLTKYFLDFALPKSELRIALYYM